MKRSRIDMTHAPDLGEAIDAMRKRTISLAWLAALTGLLALTSCDSATNTRMGTVRLYLTDAPADVAAATVWISRAELMPGHVLISDFGGVSTDFNLLALQNGVTALLGEALIDVGDYDQLRLIVDSARVTLQAPLTFEDGSTEQSLSVPSGMQTGIKVNFAGPVHVEPGVTVLVADFDVDRSFVFQGPPGGPKSVSFKPVIHATVADVAGSIAGTVDPEAARATAGLAAVLASDATDTVATTTPLADGSYILRYLPPGTYNVLVKATGFQAATAANVEVGQAQQVTGIDFTLVP
jgi:hypothetical protein